MLREMPQLASLLLLSAFAVGKHVLTWHRSSQEGRALSKPSTRGSRATLSEWLRDLPDNSELRFELGMVYLRERNWARAIENYQYSLSTNRTGSRRFFTSVRLTS